MRRAHDKSCVAAAYGDGHVSCWDVGGDETRRGVAPAPEELSESDYLPDLVALSHSPAGKNRDKCEKLSESSESQVRELSGSIWKRECTFIEPKDKSTVLDYLYF